MLIRNGNISTALTDKQECLLRYIYERVQKDGMPPTHDEIKEQFGLSSAFGVRQHLRLLQRKGYIELCPGKSRGIRVLRDADREQRRVLKIPIVGRIAAGRPILAVENLDGSVEVSDNLFPHGLLFGLRVQGNSMVKAGINSGDLAVIRQQPAVDNGQIAAVQVFDEATLKRVFVGRNRIRLKAENDDVPDIRVEASGGTDVHILGLYVGLIRYARG